MSNTTPATTSSDTPSTGWTVQFSAEFPVGTDPHALFSHLATLGGTYACETAARADYAWDEPCALAVWANGQSDVVLRELYDTSQLAVATNAAAVQSFSHSLAHVLGEREIAIEGLGFLSDQLHESLTRGRRLAGLVRTLFALAGQRGLPVAPPLESNYAINPSHAVLCVSNGALKSDADLLGEQLVTAMSSVPDPADVPDDGRSPFEEILAQFSRTPESIAPAILSTNPLKPTLL